MIQIAGIGGDKREFYRPVRFVIRSTPCFTLIEQALSVFFNVNYV